MFWRPEYTRYGLIGVSVECKYSLYSFVNSFLIYIAPLLLIALLLLINASKLSFDKGVKLSLPPASLVAIIFLQNDLNQTLPKLSYLTFLDSFILMSYFYTGIATILCVYSFVRKLKSRKNLSKIDLYAQKWGPISYFLFLFIMLIYFYNLDGTLSLLASIVS